MATWLLRRIAPARSGPTRAAMPAVRAGGTASCPDGFFAAGGVDGGWRGFGCFKIVFGGELAACPL
jgi:hypothetical protein